MFYDLIIMRLILFDSKFDIVDDKVYYGHITWDRFVFNYWSSIKRIKIWLILMLKSSIETYFILLLLFTQSESEKLML